jgi:hypothetical protein
LPFVDVEEAELASRWGGRRDGRRQRAVGFREKISEGQKWNEGGGRAEKRKADAVGRTRGGLSKGDQVFVSTLYFLGVEIIGTIYIDI